MPVFARALVGATLASILLASPASSEELPARTAGLWILKSQDNPYANWSICIDEARNDFIDTDVWKNFARECKLTASSNHGSSGKIEANCTLDDKSEAKLSIEFSGDFQKNYSFEYVRICRRCGRQKHPQGGRRGKICRTMPRRTEAGYEENDEKRLDSQALNLGARTRGVASGTPCIKKFSATGSIS